MNPSYRIVSGVIWQIFYESVLYPDVFWYRLNGMSAQNNAPKKVLATLFPYIFHVKTK